jgi:Na+/H+ antiporter NhaD/arsenite permease-like protein
MEAGPEVRAMHEGAGGPMKTAIVGVVLAAAGLAAIATGVLPERDALALAERVWPVLAFVVAITVVTELAAAAGLFTAIAEQATRWGRGSGWLLWLIVVGGAAVCTVFLSLDTTAVLLTPIVVGMARHARLDPAPFALTTVWMANAGSLLLPVSNLTNLLAQRAMGDPSPLAFAALLWAPALVAMAVPMVVIALIMRRSLGARYDVETGRHRGDTVLLWASACVVVVLLPLLVSGLPVWIPATGAALVLGGFFIARQPGALGFGLVPWRLVLLASGLFLVVEALHALGLGVLLASASGTGDGPLDLLRLAATGAVGANAINNLPAYLALEPVAGSPLRLAALLIGVNAGPLITPWASLATLLWHDRLTGADVHLPWRRVCLLGAIAAPLVVITATVTLAFAG